MRGGALRCPPLEKIGWLDRLKGFAENRLMAEAEKSGATPNKNKERTV
jgi:hypothetical protein